jgi:hypothetical protein
MTGAAPLGWSDEIDCEGGQVLVANAADFAHWFGAAAPFARAGYDSVHAFGDGHACYLWSLLPGPVRVTVDASRSFLCLAQIEYADNDAGREAAHAYALAYQLADAAAGVTYRVTEGAVVIASASSSVSATSTAIEGLPLSAASPGALIDFSSGPNAAALWLQPGLYVSSLFYHEDDRWGVSWCRLQRISD